MSNKLTFIKYAQGWDVVVVAKQNKINDALITAYNNNKIPKDFNFNYTLHFLGSPIPVMIKGVFDPLQIYAGTGKVISLHLPIKSGTISSTNGFSADISGVIVNITMNLTYVKSTLKPEHGTNYDLTIDFSEKHNAIIGIELQNLSPELEPQKVALEISLQNYLQTGTSGKSFLISTVNLNGLVQDYPYLVPTKIEYAFVTDPLNSENNTLGILMLTINHTPGQQRLLVGTLPPSYQLGAIISNDLFMEKSVIPNMAKNLKVPESYFKISGSKPATVVNTRSFVLHNVKKSPTLDSLSIEIVDNEVHFIMKAHAEASPGITIHFKIDAKYNFKVTGSGSNQKISFNQISYHHSHTVKIAAWVWITAAATIPIAWIWISILLAAIPFIIIAIIKAVISGKVGSGLASNPITAALTPVSWSFGDIDVQSIDLPGPIRLLGTA